MTPTTRPKCPNHTVEMDPTGDRRIWICPVSAARFTVDVDDTQSEVKKDKFGRPMVKFRIVSNGEQGGHS